MPQHWRGGRRALFAGAIWARCRLVLGGFIPPRSWIQSLSTNASHSLSQSRSSFTFTEGDCPTQIDSGITVTDTDFNGGSLTIQFTGEDGIDDILAIENQGSGTSQISITSGSVSYEGSALGRFTGGDAYLDPLVVSFDSPTPIAAVAALCQAITLNNTSSTPLTFDRRIEMTLVDDTGQSSNTLISVSYTHLTLPTNREV